MPFLMRGIFGPTLGPNKLSFRALLYYFPHGALCSEGGSCGWIRWVFALSYWLVRSPLPSVGLSSLGFLFSSAFVPLASRLPSCLPACLSACCFSVLFLSALSGLLLNHLGP